MTCLHGKNMKNFEIVLIDEIISKVSIYHQHVANSVKWSSVNLFVKSAQDGLTDFNYFVL